MTQKMIVIQTRNRSHIHMEPTSPRQEYITVTIEVTGSLIFKFLFVATSHDKKNIGQARAFTQNQLSREMKLQITLATPATGTNFYKSRSLYGSLFSVLQTKQESGVMQRRGAKAICLRLLPTQVKLLMLKIVKGNKRSQRGTDMRPSCLLSALLLD